MNKSVASTLFMPLTLLAAFSSTAHASAFVDYGGFGKYRQRMSDGGGCISGTIGTTIPGKNFNFVVNYAEHERTDKAQFSKGYFGFTTLDKKHDIKTPALRASAFMLCLKPGNYDIVGIEWSRTESTLPIRMPFTVEAGSNLYLGSLILHNTAIADVSCGKMPGTLAVEVQDQWQRDMPLIMRLKDAVPAKPTRLDVQKGTPYFYTCADR